MTHCGILFPTRENHLKWAVQLQVEAKLHNDSLNLESENIHLLTGILTWYNLPKEQQETVLELIGSVCNEATLELTAGAEYLETVKSIVSDVVNEIKEMSHSNTLNHGAAC